MTTFSYPLDIKRPLQPPTDTAFSARVLAIETAPINIALTGTAAATTTTLPLFVAPAGSRVLNLWADILTPYDAAIAATNLTIGTAAAPAQLLAATTVNTAGRRTYDANATQVSVNAIAFAVDTTVQAIVSINTSAVTTGNIFVYAFIA